MPVEVDVSPWRELISFWPDQSVSRFRIQRITEAHGKLSLDRYAVEIAWLPPQHETPEDFLDYVRLHLNVFSEGRTVFEPYDTDPNGPDVAKWKSKKPQGAAIAIDMLSGRFFNAEDGTVVVTDVTDCSWTFTTVETPWRDWKHPVSGHREFGIVKNDVGGFEFYTRGADRPTGRFDQVMEDVIFEGQDGIWRQVMERIADYVNDNGGSASVPKPVALKFDWGEFLDADAAAGGNLEQLLDAAEEGRLWGGRDEEAQRLVEDAERRAESLHEQKNRLEEDMRRLREMHERARLTDEERRRLELLQQQWERIRREQELTQQRQRELERERRETIDRLQAADRQRVELEGLRRDQSRQWKFNWVVTPHGAHITAVPR